MNKMRKRRIKVVMRNCNLNLLTNILKNDINTLWIIKMENGQRKY